MTHPDIRPVRRAFTAALALVPFLACFGAVSAAEQEPLVHTYRVGDAVAFSDDGAYLGVRLTEETEYAEGGARVTHVVEDSPAERAGLEAGDIVVGFEGEVIRGPVALTRQIHAREPGETVRVEVVRDGRNRKLAVELGERPGFEQLFPGVEWDSGRWAEWEDGLKERLEGLGDRVGGAYSFTVPEAPEAVAPLLWSLEKPKLGVQLVETTAELRAHLGGSDDAGVLVSKVLDGTPAERAGIRVGDLILSIDGTSVASVAELRESLSGKRGETFAVVVAREGRSQTLEVTIPEPDDDRPTGPRAHALPHRLAAPTLAPPAPRVVALAPAAAPAAAPVPPLPAPELAAPAAPVSPEPRVPAAAPAPPAAPAIVRRDTTVI